MKSISIKRNNQTKQRFYNQDAASSFFGPSTVQPKLEIGKPDDEYEKEADQVADAVMRMPDPEGERIQRKCKECEEEEKRVQRKETNSEVSGNSLSHVEELLHSSKGKSLDVQTRAFMEPRFGYDFSRVRIHDDTRANESSDKINALAYTHGDNIVFNKNQYSPETSRGKRLLAHELTHVVQQASRGGKLQRQPAAVPNYRDCNPAITSVADSNEQLDAARLRARGFVGAAIRALGSAPAAGSVYAAASARHFISPNAGQRATIIANYRLIMRTLNVSNYICNSNNICGTEQAFWIPQDDLVHVCRPFWSLSRTCQAIILIHEGAHDVGVDAAVAGHPPNRGSANYPSGNSAAPAGQTTALRMVNPDAYAFFAAHIWRNTDTGSTCF